MSLDRGLAKRFLVVQSLPKRDRDSTARTIDVYLAARGNHAA